MILFKLQVNQTCQLGFIMQATAELQILTLVLTIFCFISGIYLTIKSRPYSSLWSNLHRIGTFILIVCYILLVYPLVSAPEANNSGLVFFIITSILILFSLISGFIVAGLNSKINLILWLHRILPFLCLATGIASFLLVN
jgi:hypothetical protein